jgi:organic hydroperoxide reductase OsmC/OhrA
VSSASRLPFIGNIVDIELEFFGIQLSVMISQIADTIEFFTIRVPLLIPGKKECIDRIEKAHQKKSDMCPYAYRAVIRLADRIINTWVDTQYM